MKFGLIKSVLCSLTALQDLVHQSWTEAEPQGISVGSLKESVNVLSPAATPKETLPALPLSDGGGTYI